MIGKEKRKKELIANLEKIYDAIRVSVHVAGSHSFVVVVSMLT